MKPVCWRHSAVSWPLTIPLSGEYNDITISKQICITHFKKQYTLQSEFIESEWISSNNKWKMIKRSISGVHDGALWMQVSKFKQR